MVASCWYLEMVAVGASIQRRLASAAHQGLGVLVCFGLPWPSHQSQGFNIYQHSSGTRGVPEDHTRQISSGRAHGCRAFVDVRDTYFPVEEAGDLGGEGGALAICQPILKPDSLMDSRALGAPHPEPTCFLPAFCLTASADSAPATQNFFQLLK